MTDGALEQAATEEGGKEWDKSIEGHKDIISEVEQTWGFDRLDQLADYFSKHTDKLNKVYPNWGASIERYRNLKPEAQKKFAEITDNYERYNFLLGQARMITLLYPEEIQRIYFAEKKTGRFPYLDSLLDAATNMYRVPIGNSSPYQKNDVSGAGGIVRHNLLRRLSFGAKTSNETSGIFKRQIFPIKF